MGNGELTLNEQRAHFALWALLKAPLMVGTDLAKLSPDGYRILLAKEVIAVNQDPLGVAGDLVWKEGPAEARRPAKAPRKVDFLGGKQRTVSLACKLGRKSAAFCLFWAKCRHFGPF